MADDQAADAVPAEIKDTPKSKGQGHKNKKDESVLEGEDELFMTLTSAEKKQWHDMMKARKEKLVKNTEDHQRWVEAFTRRRMFAYSRIRKLDNARRDRFRFVFKMAEVVRSANDKIFELNNSSAASVESDSKTDDNKSEGNTESSSNINSNNNNDNNNNNNNNNHGDDDQSSNNHHNDNEGTDVAVDDNEKRVNENSDGNGAVVDNNDVNVTEYEDGNNRTEENAGETTTI